ncbi:P-loop NTPase fold protein [Aquimarina sp. AU474]|uniref:P-loop NTPase fold protein n=1 Tax=Aquimarina sp. AU474 TaxID=2108529 RepID=UPI000D68A488|nr:P-loop NTPase fold protein [Aquimarina sp. AU474]
MESSNIAPFYDFGIDVSPNEADIAFAPVDTFGNPGPLNQFVLNTYGYDEKALASLNLEKGYDWLELKGRKPIVFVVTIDQKGMSSDALRTNLSRAIEEYINFFSSKMIWMALMGTGTGRIPILISHSITSSVIDSFAPQLQEMFIRFIISLPKNKEGRDLLKSVQSPTDEYSSSTISNENVQQKQQTKLKSKIDSTAIDLDAEQLETSPTIGKYIENEEFITNHSGSFYLAGSSWNKGTEDQTQRFFDQNVWEDGHEDERYSRIINSIVEGDILILKSTYGQNHKSYLRIKGFGIVTKNNNNGKSLLVDWKIKDLQVNIENLGHYRATITDPKKEDLATMFSYIEPEIITSLKQVSATITSVTKITTIAGLVSDSDSGIDHLNISKDISAFARVIAAKSFTPPLAIALFGKWGSGKSFFMRKLKERIKLLSQTNPEKGFCEGIAHVHFNAWSYMDANLWAGIITKIFDGLNQYIQDNSAGDNYKQEIEKVLTNKLNITNSELIELEKKKDVIDAQLASLKSERDSIAQKLKEKIEEIEDTTITQLFKKVDDEFKVEETIESAIKNNITILKNKEQFSEIVPKEYWKTPDELYKQSKSIFTFLKVFFKAGKWHTNLAWVIVIIGLILGIPPILTYIANTTQWANFSFPNELWYGLTVAGTFYHRGIKTYKQLQPLVASFWEIKEDYELKKEDALFQFSQREKALTLEIEQIKEEIIDINHQILQTTEQKAEIQFRLDNTLSTEALHSFIEKRSASKEYEKHLGLVSIIRKDFEILSNLFTDHHEELKNIVENKETKEFRDKFERPLQRIILYIDDLDRCPEERVVEVLEAVNLLMAYPLFVVVVGVDPRWVKNALIKKHQMQFVKSNQSADMEMIDPSSYLEKIFQVPFNLKAAEDKSVKHMLKTLAEVKPLATNLDPNTKTTPVADDIGTSDEISKPQEVVEPFTVGKSPVGEAPIGLSNYIETKETLESLQLSINEVELLQDMSDIIGPSPRAIKRFVNIYRIVKAHENFGYTNEKNPHEIMAVLLLLAIPIGKFKKLHGSFEAFVEGYAGRNKLSKYFDNPSKIEDTEELRTLKVSFNNALSSKNNILSQNIEFFKHHHPFIKRFAFNGD